MQVPEPPALEQQETPTLPSGALRESTSSYGKAQQIQQSVAERLRSVDEQTKKHRVGSGQIRRGVSVEAAGARTLLRNPLLLREAMVTSIVLGPPRALNEGPFA
jgi:hypothetical protein